MSRTTIPENYLSPVAQGQNVRRSYSVSRVGTSTRLPGRHAPRRHSSCPAHRCFPTAPTQYHTPMEDFPTSPLSWTLPATYQTLSPAHSTSVLELGATTESFIMRLPNSNEVKSSGCEFNGTHDAEISSQGVETDSIMQNDTTFQLHRLSLLTNNGSERASTLIGSDAEEEELEREGVNPFDSIRTRVNDGAVPRHVELLFEPQELPEEKLLSKGENNDRTDRTINSPHPDISVRKHQNTGPADSLEESESNDEDDAEWDSDWGSPKRTKLERRCSPIRPKFTDVDALADQSDDTAIAFPSDFGTERIAWHSRNATQTDKPRATSATHSRSQSLPTKAAKHLPSENWDDDFEDDGFGLGQGEVIVPQAIQERQQKVIRHLDSVREFAALVEKLKHLVERAVICGARWGSSETLWDEAEAVIAIASTGTSDDEEEDRSRGRSVSVDFRTRLTHDAKPYRGEESPATVKSHAPRSKGYMNKSYERPHVRHMREPSSSSETSLQIFTKSDPVAVARTMMERMQLNSGSTPVEPTEDKLQFDTKMLGPLLEKARKLLRDLEESITNESNSPAIAESLQAGLRVIGDADFEFGLSRGAEGVQVV